MLDIDITADDLGISRKATDTLLETADRGALTRVSVIPNGYAVPYALEEWKKRQDRLSLSVHLNLTEGRSCSDPVRIPRLVDSNGSFRYSAPGLLLRSLFASSKERDALRAEIRRELEAQMKVVRDLVGDVPLGVDGHLHMHMIPMVFGIIAAMHAKERFSQVRMPQEPLFLEFSQLRMYMNIGIIRHVSLNLLAHLNTRRALRSGLTFTDRFIGTLLSGQQTRSAVEAALAETAREGAKSVEINFHPGTADEEELKEWKGDTGWHTSPWRERERALLMDPGFVTLLQAFRAGSSGNRGSKLLEIGRFGIAGGIATGTNLLFLYLFTDVAGIWYVLSAVLAYAVATGVSFTLQKFWAFSHRATDRIPHEIAWYIGNNVLGVAFDMIGLYLLVEYTGIWYMAAQFILLAIIATWNFFVFRFFIFKHRDPV